MIRTKIGIMLGLFIIVFSSAAWAESTKKTVEGVYKEKAQLQGKQVQVRGKVVKVNNGIMKRNFLHIQDGSGSQGTNDLIVTSKQTAKVGEEITITGTVVLDTDFGFGYKYPLLVDQSTIENHSAK